MLNVDPHATIPVTNTGRGPMKVGDFTLQPGIPTVVPASYMATYGENPWLRWDYSPFAEMLGDRTEDGRPLFDFHAPLSAVDGYGRHALDIWRGLTALGVEARLRPCPFNILGETYLPSHIKSMAYENKYRPPSRVAVTMSVPYDPTISRNDSIKRLAITQFETDLIPGRHIEAINKVDHLITTSHFQPVVWRKSGLKVPIDVLVPGVDTDFFEYRERERGNRFRVLMLGALSGRKNVEGAIRIFQAASHGDPGWQMTIKTRGGTLTPAAIHAARHDGRITVLGKDVPPNQVRDFYWEHDCLLWPSKGEGVGLPPLEAMATGMEVVIADNSGMSDYVSSSICYPIKTERQEPAGYPGNPQGFSQKYVAEYGDVGNWWVPDEAHGVKQLQSCFRNWYEHKGKGVHAATYVRQHHTLEHQAKSVLKVVEKYL